MLCEFCWKFHPLSSSERLFKICQHLTRAKMKVAPFYDSRYGINLLHFSGRTDQWRLFVRHSRDCTVKNCWTDRRPVRGRDAWTRKNINLSIGVRKDIFPYTMRPKYNLHFAGNEITSIWKNITRNCGALKMRDWNMRDQGKLKYIVQLYINTRVID